MSSVLAIDFSTVSGGNRLNPIGRKLRAFLLESLRRAERSADIESVVLIGGSGHFSAGADLTEFGSLKDSDSDASLLDVVDRLENFPKPVVAAISGAALGGGLELALACHYRVSDAGAKLGLPEVNVGVIPGAGGTQRLPRLVGVTKAVQMITTGSAIGAEEAFKLGLLDAIVESDSLLAEATGWARWAELMPLEDRRVGRRTLSEDPAPILAAAAKKLPRPEMGGEGVHAALEAIAASKLPIDQGMKVESECFLKTLEGAQGNARRHGFFAVRLAQKPVHPAAMPRGHHLLRKSSVGQEAAVIGAGLMGSGIAMVLLQAGFTVHLYDVSKDSLKKGTAFLRSTNKSYVKRGKISASKGKQLMNALRPTLKLEDLSNCGLVVEAVIEKMAIKKSIFKSLDQITPPHAVLLSNTSSLDVDEMASAVRPDRRARFAGWHFFSPAHVMKLVEIVVGKDTSPEIVSVLQALTKRVGKIGVVVGNCDGFVGNRMLVPYSGETEMLLAEGVGTIASIDRAFVKFGMALGPFTMGDLAGLDVGYNVRAARKWTDESSPTRPERYSGLADDVVAKYKRLGQKNGKGWYDYDPNIGKGRKPLPSKEMEEVVKLYAKKGQPQFSDRQIIERVFFPLVNEGFKILEEGIAHKPSDIDVVYMNGYGWPVYRGGPMYWADNEVTLPYLLAKLEEFSEKFPSVNYFKPSKLLRECVRQGVTVEKFYSMGLHKKYTASKL